MSNYFFLVSRIIGKGGPHYVAILPGGLHNAQKRVCVCVGCVCGVCVGCVWGVWGVCVCVCGVGCVCVCVCVCVCEWPALVVVPVSSWARLSCCTGRTQSVGCLLHSPKKGFVRTLMFCPLMQAVTKPRWAKTSMILSPWSNSRAWWVTRVGFLSIPVRPGVRMTPTRFVLKLLAFAFLL